MTQFPTPQTPNSSAFIDPANSHPLLRYFQKVQFKYMEMDNFGLSLDDAGEIKKQQRVFLRDLFVAPHLSKRHIDPEQVISLEAKSNERPEWQSIVEVLQQHPHSFVLGDPGTGKSTLIHWLMLAFSTSGSNLTKIALGELVPFALILRELPLREVRSFADLWAVFTAHNQEATQAFENSNVIEMLLNSGQALILLDGLDEITHDETRRNLGAAILEGMCRYPATRFVISSRVVGFDQRQLFGLKTDETEPLALKDQLGLQADTTELLARKDQQVLPVSYIAPFTYPQAQQFVGNWYQQYHPHHDGNHAQRVSELLARIQKNDGLGRLSRIPVLLNMICFIHARRGRMPDGRAELYQRIAETYLVTLDTARSISPYRGESNITFDYADRSDWLSAIALTMQQNRSEGETAILIPEAKVRCTLREKLLELDVPEEQIDCEISFLLRDFAERSGLFLPRGKNAAGEEQYGFSHLSFLEYFAAKALRRQAELGDIDWADLQQKTQSVWWQESLVLFFEQLEDAKLTAKYLEKLFPIPEHQGDETPNAPVTAQTLLAAIVMDSGVKLLHNKRQTLISQLWAFYLQLPLSLDYQALANRLWQPDFSAIELGLAQMATVKELNLAGTEIADLSLLAGFTQLRTLVVWSTKVSDVSALAGLTQLQLLALLNTAVSDVSALAGLTQLQGLYLRNTAVSDVSALVGLTQLKTLDLGNTAISDVSALAGLTQLQQLHLSNTAVSDVSALAGLNQLQELYLDDTPVSDVSALAELTQLKKLDLRETTVSDVSSLARLTQLQILYLSRTSFSDVFELVGLTQLIELYLSNVSVRDVSALAGLTQLKTLYLHSTAISDVSALAGLTQLQTLNLSYTAVSDVSSLAGLTQLRELDLRNTSVSDVSALAGLTNLKIIR